jgi:hypothetical protein
MPTTYARGGSAGDARAGSGYGTLRTQLGSSSEAEKLWPYTAYTDIERQAAEDVDDEEASRRVIAKRNRKQLSNDRLQQLNYKSNSFVNGQTRGLTGIMSGVDAVAVLEAFIGEVVPRRRPREDIKPFGTGGPNPNAMSSDPRTRTRPGMTLGSKAGWFGPPPPKDTDPALSDPLLDLRDLPSKQDRRAVRNASIEKKHVQRDRLREGGMHLLRRYVGLCIIV